jgi:hypothetical protein
MKWSPTGWGAKIVEGEREYSLPVEKWGPKDGAMVAMTDSPKLVPVTKVPGFKELVPYHRVVSVLPAAPGWKVQAERFGPFAPYTAPIAAWVMDGEGIFWPVIGVSEPEDGGPHRPSPDGEYTLRPHLSTGNKIIAPEA